MDLDFLSNQSWRLWGQDRLLTDVSCKKPRAILNTSIAVDFRIEPDLSLNIVLFQTSILIPKTIIRDCCGSCKPKRRWPHPLLQADADGVPAAAMLSCRSKREVRAVVASHHGRICAMPRESQFQHKIMLRRAQNQQKNEVPGKNAKIAKP
jgi:hypothetical protein